MSAAPTPSAKKPNFLSKLSLRAQLLIFAAVFLVGIGVWTSVKGRRSASPAAPTAKAATPQSGASSVTMEPIATAPQQRLPQPSPTAEEQRTLNNQKAAAVDPRDDQTMRSIGTPIAASVPRKAGDDDYEAEETSSGKRAAGVPYSARNSRSVPHEIFGVMSPPAPATPARVNPPQSVPQDVGQVTPHQSAPQRFAPFGRLVKCVLVNTIDSLTPSNAPIIALTVEPVAWNNDTIIPVNTEVFSYVNTEPKMDARGVGRLFDNGEWTLVLPRQAGGANGREWQVRGRALDRRELVVEPEGRVRLWGIDDMAPGFIGYTVNTLDQQEIKLFIASFLGAASKALGETLQTREPVPGMGGAFGAMQPQPTVRNAALNAGGQGAGAVMDAAAERITEEIKRRGFYVRVPASKEFYLFIEQTLDPSEARVGLRMPSNTPPSSQPTQQATR